MVLWKGRRGVAATAAAASAVVALLAATLPAAALAAAPAAARASVAPTVVRAPAAAAFVRHQQRAAADPAAALGRTVDDLLGLGLLPSPVEVAGGRGLTTATARDLPDKFDLRTQGTLPPVKQQHPYGTCWAFATMAALETALTPQSSQDLSEDNLVNYSGFGYDDPYTHGGDYTNSLAYLLRGAGPVLDAADAYPTPQVTLDATVVDEVQDVMLLPGFSVAGVTETVKTFLMQHGAVATSMTWSVDPVCLETETAAYYYAGTKEANHAVTIIGWDDHYPRQGFLAGAQPKDDGAWIVRNSWGTDWGDKGYFYVSYDDTMFGRNGNNTAFLRITAPQSGERIYGWDQLGWVTSLGYASTTAATDGWMANAFTATGRERLAAVGFYRTAAAGGYTVYAGTSLTRLRKVAAGTITVGGFFRVPIADGLRLRRGQRFVVAVHVDTAGYSFPLPIQAPLTGYADPAGVPGVSFISPDGRHWTGVERVVPRSNVCLKAYTVK